MSEGPESGPESDEPEISCHLQIGVVHHKLLCDDLADERQVQRLRCIRGLYRLEVVEADAAEGMSLQDQERYSPQVEPSGSRTIVASAVITTLTIVA